MTIEFIILFIFMFIFGSVFGSFACCQAWRIHEKSEGKKLGSRSVCLKCNTQLKWYDNLPIISWLMLGGKCRKCKAKIGKAEILSEIGLGLAFVGVAYATTNHYFSVEHGYLNFINLPFYPDLLLPILFLIMLVPFWVLLVYDAKWGELPVLPMILEIVLALIYQFINHGDWLQIGLSVSILSGIYYLLFFFSKEKWVGGGDWILCTSIAIILGHFELAFVELFLSNFMASFAALPGATKKNKKQIPFGPFLIIALIIIYTFKSFLSNFLLVL